MRILISGGPGSGCTSTALLLGQRLNIPVFDSDVFFHKPTTPPYQEQYSVSERRSLLYSKVSTYSKWIISGSIATWGVTDIHPRVGVFLDIPKEMRMNRLLLRERARFGEDISIGGSMYEDHLEFMDWASEYEVRVGIGRNLGTDRQFLSESCEFFLNCNSLSSIDELIEEILSSQIFKDALVE